MMDTACIYLKPSKNFREYLSNSRIEPVSDNLGFHTTLAFLKFPYDFKEAEDDVFASIKKVAQDTSVSQGYISNIELWDNYSLLIGGFAKEDIERVHNYLNLRLNLSGIRINNTYANVNKTIFKEDYGYMPLGYTPHISIKYMGEINTLEGVNFCFEPYIYLLAKTQKRGTLEQVIAMDQ